MFLRASFTGEIMLDEMLVADENIFPEVRGLKGPFACLNSARYGIALGHSWWQKTATGGPGTTF